MVQKKTGFLKKAQPTGFWGFISFWASLSFFFGYFYLNEQLGSLLVDLLIS